MIARLCGCHFCYWAEWGSARRATFGELLAGYVVFGDPNVFLGLVCFLPGGKFCLQGGQLAKAAAMKTLHSPRLAAQLVEEC